jgi:hypothetical protein
MQHEIVSDGSDCFSVYPLISAASVCVGWESAAEEAA